MDNVPGCSDGRARRALWTDEQEKYQAYRKHSADGDAPCHLPVGHVGGGARVWSQSPSVRVELHQERNRENFLSRLEYAGKICPVMSELSEELGWKELKL